MSENHRLLEHRDRKKNWKNWGPYLSERAWGTVREDYGNGSTWSSFPFDQAHKRVFRWGEDGLGGICDRFQYICFSLALWNGKDPILKERFFGLGGDEGNHGEDIKEIYYYLDATPTSSYLKMLYKYPQREFPYRQLRKENQKRGLDQREYELLDTEVFAEDRYFDVLIEYAKENEEDIFCRITIRNRGPEKAALTILPTIWFRNTWRWGYENGPTGDEGGKPSLWEEEEAVHLKHPNIGDYFFYVHAPEEWLFCENEEGVSYPKDAIARYILEKQEINPEKKGTKTAARFNFNLASGEEKQILCRITNQKQTTPFQNVSELFDKRRKEADDYYSIIQEENLSKEMKEIQRQAFAGLLFNRQFYYLDQVQWLKGDPHLPSHHSKVRNAEWEHLLTFDILSMPDKWEYPYFCAWDMAFHCLPLVIIDPDYAKRQLTLMTREWYMHPNGQLPSYEWCFSDVNPPVHAWALWRVYKIDAKKQGNYDRSFLEGNFHKLLLNFTWWVNKKDKEGNNVFQGGFLGMDNISVFDRSRDLPTGGHIDQSDGSAWVSFYCIILMKIALHLAKEEPVYQDMATKFFEHFLRIASAMSHCGGRDGHHSLWNEEDGFFYDLLHLPNDEVVPLKVRSLVGLLPLLCVETIEPDLLKEMPVFERRMNWFISKRPEISFNISCLYEGGKKDRRLMSILTKERLIRVLKYMLDENEFLSPYGIRSLSKFHQDNPYVFEANGNPYEVRYIPGESDNQMFGGNSNWRGPVWFPINFLLIEALQRYHHYYGDELKVEFPTGSGNFLNLWDVATELSRRLIRLFIPNSEGRIPIYGEESFHEHFLFHEYFHGDTGKGLGACHQTGWTGLVAKLIQQSGMYL